MEAELLELMGSTVQYLPPAAMDGYGKRTYGAAQPLQAYVKGETSEVTGPDGTIVTGAGYALTPYTPGISTSGKLTLPDGSTRGIVAVEHPMDETGPHHTKLTYGQQ